MTSSASGVKFSAPDCDFTGNLRCAKTRGSGWWFTDCGKCNLNGLLNKTGDMGLHWGKRTLTQAYAYIKPSVTPVNCCPNTCHNGGSCRRTTAA